MYVLNKSKASRQCIKMQAGMGYIEVVSSIMIIFMVIGYISSTLIHEKRVAVAASSLRMATCQAEMILDAVEEQIVPFLQKRYNEVNIKSEIKDQTLRQISLITLMDERYNQFTGKDLMPSEIAHPYAYEVVVCPVVDVLMTEGEKVNILDAKRGLVFYSDDAYKSSVKESIEEYIDQQGEVKVAFMSDERAKLLEISKKTDELSTYQIVFDEHTSSGIIKGNTKQFHIREEQIKSKDNKKILEVLYHISGDEELFKEIDAKKPIIIHFTLENEGEHLIALPYEIKIINKTNQHFIVRVNRKDGLEGKDYLKVVDEGRGKSEVQWGDFGNCYNQLFIAILVKDKMPAIGKTGRIVKLLAKIYSYSIEGDLL